MSSKLELQNPDNENEKFVIEVKDNGVEICRVNTVETRETQTISENETRETITTVITRKVGQRIENFNNI